MKTSFLNMGKGPLTSVFIGKDRYLSFQWIFGKLFSLYLGKKEWKQRKQKEVNPPVILIVNAVPSRGVTSRDRSMPLRFSGGETFLLWWVLYLPCSVPRHFFPRYVRIYFFLRFALPAELGVGVLPLLGILVVVIIEVGSIIVVLICGILLQCGGGKLLIFHGSCPSFHTRDM